MNFRSFVLSGLSLAIGLVIALVLAEAVVRLSGVATPLTYLPNPYYGWSHTPSDEFQQETENRSVKISINSQGLRDHEYPYDKPPATRRILLLGDSFAEAVQVPLADTFAKLLEKRLNAGDERGNPPVEVLNGGISGYGTDNALLFFRHEGRKYQPDVVLLAFFVGNDIRNNWYRLENLDSGGSRKPYFTRNADGLTINAYPFEEHRSLRSRLKIFLNRNIYLYSLLRQMRDRLRSRAFVGEKTAGGVALDTQVFATDYLPEWNEAFAVTEGLLLKLDNEARESGAELLVVLIPAQFQVHESYWQTRMERVPSMRDLGWDLEKPNRRLNEFLAARGIAHLDLLPDFRHYADESNGEYYLVEDKHWNEAGHRLAARLIEAKLRGMLEPTVIEPTGDAASVLR